MGFLDPWKFRRWQEIGNSLGYCVEWLDSLSLFGIKAHHKVWLGVSCTCDSTKNLETLPFEFAFDKINFLERMAGPIWKHLDETFPSLVGNWWPKH
jgi:hypothetical protein